VLQTVRATLGGALRARLGPAAPHTRPLLPDVPATLPRDDAPAALPRRARAQRLSAARGCCLCRAPGRPHVLRNLALGAQRVHPAPRAACLPNHRLGRRLVGCRRHQRPGLLPPLSRSCAQPACPPARPAPHLHPGRSLRLFVIKRIVFTDHRGGKRGPRIRGTTPSRGPSRGRSRAPAAAAVAPRLPPRLGTPAARVNPNPSPERLQRQASGNIQLYRNESNLGVFPYSAVFPAPVPPLVCSSLSRARAF